jgi:hypothetical protein
LATTDSQAGEKKKSRLSDIKRYDSVCPKRPLFTTSSFLLLFTNEESEREKEESTLISSCDYVLLEG